MQYLLVEHNNDIFWAFNSKESPMFYVDYRFFKIPKSNDDTILETCEASCFEELDFNKASLVDNYLESGWLSPLGDFIGCKPFDHDAVAHFVLKSRGSDLEKFGWVRIYSIKNKNFYPEDRLSEAQEVFFLQSE